MSKLCRAKPEIADAGRYAPSPSAPLHIGNLRTALIAWLAARSRGAPFVLRIEDLDRERSRPEHERSQLADLAALGLDWDGPVMRQSERLEEHREAFERLRAAGRVYPCWCTRADVREAASAPHAAAGPGRYPGTCRHLSDDQRRCRAHEAGRKPVWRLDGRAERVHFHDLLRGPCEGVVDDVVLWRADDAPAYNLAVVVDDDAQSVGEVVRGDDLIDSTATQISIAGILGMTSPAYLHVPLVLGPERRRLAKRDGAVTLGQRLAAGETVPQIITWMAHGAGLANSEQPTSLDALLSSFEPRRLAREPVILPPTGSL
ncbi:MAG TPA: tRNA glutamyl-Q(34) synthetase GluQRS [Solirubrobacteraceae bacterium]|jgi:glutamyl-tRNA synthetase|nr:tRNA glutamyl-Q(34) synthetase GluQRS [Solirubrobacteraceae bacterium]